MFSSKSLRIRNQRFVTAVLLNAVQELGGVTLAAQSASGRCKVCGEQDSTTHWHSEAEIQASATIDDESQVGLLLVNAEMGS